jgi:hypothetical protein
MGIVVQRKFKLSCAGLPRAVLGSAVVFSCMLFSQASDAGSVRGKITGFVHLRNPVWAEARSANSHTYTFREPSPTVKAELRQLYPHVPRELCIAVLGAQAAKLPPQTIQIGGGGGNPTTIVVSPGTEIHFRNTDPFQHRLYGVGVKSFNAGDTKGGGERIWTVPEAGTFEIRDELSPSLRIWVVADSHVVRSGFADMSGVFTIPMDVPGEYSIQVYFAGKPIGDALAAKLANANVVVDLSGTPIVVAKGPAKESEAQKGESE